MRWAVGFALAVGLTAGVSIGACVRSPKTCDALFGAKRTS